MADSPNFPTSMHTGSSRVWDSPQLTLSNLAGGNLSGAIQAWKAPDELSPEERRKLSDRLGLTGTMFAPLIDISTNPMVIAGAAMALSKRFPLPTAAALQTFKETSRGIVQSSITFLEKLAPLRWNYRGTKVPDLFEAGHARHIQAMSGYQKKLGDAIQRYEGATGAKDISEDVHRRVAAHLDGLGGGEKNPSWSVLRDAIGRHKKGVYSSQMGYTEGEAARLHAKLDRRPVIRLSGAEQNLADDFKSITNDVYGKLYKDPDDLDAVLEAMNSYYGHAPRKFGKTAGRVHKQETIKYLQKYLPRFVKKKHNGFDRAIQDLLTLIDRLKP